MYKQFGLAVLLWLWSGAAAAQIPASRVLCTGTACTPVVASSTYTFLSTAAVQAAQIKGSAGMVWAVICFNVGADTSHIRLYNQTGAPGTGDGANILWRAVIPPAASGVPGGFVYVSTNSINFGTGIGIRVSEGIANTDATALNVDGVTCTVEYQ